MKAEDFDKKFDDDKEDIIDDLDLSSARRVSYEQKRIKAEAMDRGDSLPLN